MFSRSFGTRWHEKEREKVWNWFNLMLSGERNEYFPLFRKFFSDLAGFYVHIGSDYVPQWCSWAVKSPELLSSPLWAANRKFCLRVFIRINLWICRCRFGINLQLTYHPIFQAEGVGDVILSLYWIAIRLTFGWGENINEPGFWGWDL